LINPKGVLIVAIVIDDYVIGKEEQAVVSLEAVGGDEVVS
jgi:hypothetical protein